MKVRIETVGDFKSGLGHLTRMQVLAEELAEKFKADVVLADANAELETDADLVIVDVDQYNDAHARVMLVQQEIPNARIMVFRNGKDWDDLGVDSTIIPKWSNVILHRAFRQPVDRQHNQQPGVITVFQGASDPWGLTPRVMNVLDLLYMRARIFCVLGAAVSDLTMTTMNQFNRNTRLMNVNTVVNADQPTMAELFSVSDIAILPPGQAWAEAAAMQCPTIILGHHQRHYDEGEKIRKKNAGLHLGVGVGMDDMELVKGLSAALERMLNMSVRMGYVSNALKMVNVDGVDKILHEIKGIMNVA